MKIECFGENYLTLYENILLKDIFFSKVHQLSNTVKTALTWDNATLRPKVNVDFIAYERSVCNVLIGFLNQEFTLLEEEFFKQLSIVANRIDLYRDVTNKIQVGVIIDIKRKDDTNKLLVPTSTFGIWFYAK